jgi:hypothetical protein
MVCSRKPSTNTRTKAHPELVKVYEKVLPDVWSLKGYFDLVDYKIVHDGKRNVSGIFYEARSLVYRPLLRC